MVEQQFSDDGQWMWNGKEWVPAPNSNDILPTTAIDQKQIQEVAKEFGVDSNQLANLAPHFDENKDGSLQRSELQQAAVAIANPPTVNSPPESSFPAKDDVIEEEDKPWQIKIVSILIIVMASLGGVIGQQVSTIDEKATTYENNAARNMSAARAVETLENQVVFRDESLVVEAKSLNLEAQQLNSKIGLSEIRVMEAWDELIKYDLELSLLEILLDGSWDTESLAYTLCVGGDLATTGCSIYFVNENTQLSEDNSCQYLDEFQENCALRLVFSKEGLEQYEFEQSGITFSFVSLYTQLENYLAAPPSWSNSTFTFFGEESTAPGNLFVSNIDSSYHPMAEESNTPELWDCIYTDSICVDLALSGDGIFGLSWDEYDAPIISYTVLNSELEGEVGVSGVRDGILFVRGITELEQQSGVEEFGNASGAGLAYELAYYDFLISLYDSRFSELVYAYNQVFPKFDESFTDWLLNIIEFEEARTNYNETINQSVALIDETFSWKNGFISNQTGDYLEENGREQYLQLAYNESNELYVIADSQTKNAADMRQKAVDVYSSILYISVATALCGVVSGRIGSGKYSMTLPMVLVGIISFVIGCIKFAGGIIS